MRSNDQHILVGDTSFGSACILAGTMVPCLLNQCLYCTLKKSLPGSPIFHFREGVLLQNLAGGADAGCENLQVTNNIFKIYSYIYG